MTTHIRTAALLLGVAAWLFLRSDSDGALRLATDPNALTWLVVGIVAVWFVWILVIWRTYARRRPHNATWPARFLGTVGVLVLCGAVSAPMAVGARYAVVQRDLLGSVFGEQVRTGWFLLLTIAGGLVMVGAVLVLARSPLLAGDSGRNERRERPREWPARSAARGVDG